MKHEGKAFRDGARIIGASLALWVAVLLVGGLGMVLGRWVLALAGVLFLAWALFAGFCLWFFRDPNPQVPPTPGVYVAPAHGKVDVIDEVTETEFMGGRCRRISMFLSVFDVHVQQAPVAGRVAYLRRHPGEFLNAMRLESGAVNENVMIGLESREVAGEKVGVRLIAGWIARRILPWVAPGDTPERGERISLIRFGSRVDLYLPLAAEVRVRLGDRVRGGETVMAVRG